MPHRYTLNAQPGVAQPTAQPAAQPAVQPTRREDPTLSLWKPPERVFARAISRMIYTNPFLPDRIAREREAQGAEFIEGDSDWNVRAESEGQHPNITRMTERAGVLIHQARDRLAAGLRPSQEDLRLYEDLAIFFLYHHYYGDLQELCRTDESAVEKRRPVAFYPRLREDLERLLVIPGLGQTGPEDLPRLFAFFFQVRRAFHHIFHFIVGTSRPVVWLRAAAWQSIFTHDMRRYRAALYERLGDFATLITGASGTGKELVARAIGLSQYIPFDPATGAFTDDFTGSFHALDLSTLSPTLIESELFGHRRGSFTGAIEDRAGWLEICSPRGTVFLDEVGEIGLPIQVKLLRVLQTRVFQRIGDTRRREFRGKIIAATNRDLAAEIEAGRFRPELYYRICSDMIRTPSLREQLDADPRELPRLVAFVSRRVAGGAGESLAAEVLSWIVKHLGADYAWPGNFRELEQCARNILVRGEYHPARAAPQASADRLAAQVVRGDLTADDLLDRYCSLVRSRVESDEAAGRRLGLDRRTVKKRAEAGRAADARLEA